MSAIVICLSDLHFGKRSERFDLRTAHRRMRQLVGKINAKTPSEVCLLLLGDLAEGEGIFPSQNATNEVSSRQQVIACTAAIHSVARDVHERWPRAVVRIVSIPGNHGRIDKRAHPDSNRDLEVADKLADQLSAEPWCTVRPSRGITSTVSIGGKRIVAIHRAEKSAVTAAGIGRVLRRLAHYEADLLVAGHWHQPAAYEIDGALRYVINGSLCGWDGYSEQLGCFDEPAQAILSVGAGVISVSWVRW